MIAFISESSVTVIVFVAPLPDAVTVSPTKLRVVASVESAEPSSLTVTPPPA